MKKLTAIILTLAMVLSFAGCGEIQKAESAVNGMLTALMNFEFEEMQKYVSADGEPLFDSDEDIESSRALAEALFADLNYEIISSEKVDDSTVVVKTKITTTDMKPVLGEFFAKWMEFAFENALSSAPISDEEMEAKAMEMFAECLSAEELETVTNQVDIKVAENENGEWKIEMDDNLTGALMGGLTEAIEELQESMGDE